MHLEMQNEDNLKAVHSLIYFELTLEGVFNFYTGAVMPSKNGFIL